jgi:TorA maturation chaperone TorD
MGGPARPELAPDVVRLLPDAVASGVSPARDLAAPGLGPAVGSTDLALARSVLYECLALGFDRPSLVTVERIGRAIAGGLLARAVEQVTAAQVAAAPLAGAVCRLAAAGRPEPQALAVRFDQLFGHTTRGEVCAFETEYGADALFQQPQNLADIAGYYRAFGLELLAEAGRVDHIACECEFLSFLAQKEAYTIEALTTLDASRDSMRWAAPAGQPRASDRDALRVTLEETRRAARLFLRDHIGRAGRALGTRLSRVDPEGFYGALGALLAGLIAADCVRLAVEPGPLVLELRSTAPDLVPMACGGSEEPLVQIQRRRP